MIFNVGAGGATDADKIKYGDSTVGATLDNLNESVDELNESVDELDKSVDELNESLGDFVNRSDRTTNYQALSIGTDFICPNDGYIRVNPSDEKVTYTTIVNVKNTQFGYITLIKIADETKNIASVFVTKGMTIKWDSGSSNARCVFIPLA